MMPLIVHTIPAFTDNYIWLFHQQGSCDAYVVDPGDAKPVLEALERLGLTLKGILITHHHPDHVGGIEQLLTQYPVPVYGPKGITQATEIMVDGSTLEVGEALFNVIEIPGHTLDHIAYYAASEPLVFLGDTIFANGCGRLFEGSPEQMWHSLSRLASLPPETKLYCAHEYTEANTRFALAVEPDNSDLKRRAQDIAEIRAENKPTIPSTLAMELATNPFMRANQLSIKKAAEKYGQCTVSSETETFALIRQWKDNF